MVGQSALWEAEDQEWHITCPFLKVEEHCRGVTAQAIDAAKTALWAGIWEVLVGMLELLRQVAPQFTDVQGGLNENGADRL